MHNNCGEYTVCKDQIGGPISPSGKTCECINDLHEPTGDGLSCRPIQCSSAVLSIDSGGYTVVTKGVYGMSNTQGARIKFVCDAG